MSVTPGAHSPAAFPELDVSEAMPRGKSGRVAGDPSAGSKFLVVLAVCFSFALAAYVLAVTVVLPRVRISRVVVQADFEMERDRLLELAELDGRRYYHAIDPDSIARRLEEYTMIKSAEVERVFPNTVRLDLVRRRPLVVALWPRDGTSVPAVLDETGTILDAGPHVADYDAPVLSGIAFEGDVVGRVVPERVHPVLESLHALRVEASGIFSLISEVRIETRTAGGIDVLIFTEGFRVPVRMNSRFDKETCTYALMVLDVLVKRGESEDISEVDFRTGEVVYRMTEDEGAR
jgi:cell division protein FtsQ